MTVIGTPPGKRAEGTGHPPRSTPATWVRQTIGSVTCVDWADWLDSDTAVDPYLIWADLTDFAGFGGWRADDEAHRGKLPFLVELAAKAPKNIHATRPEDIAKVGCAYALMDIAAAYFVPLVEGDPTCLSSDYFTARISPHCLPELLKDKTIRRMQLGVPRLPAIDPVPTVVNADTSRDTIPRTVIGVIDDGCAFANPAFCDNRGVTRVQFLWDQDEARAEQKHPDWHVRPEKFGYGAELRPQALAKASRQAAVEGNDDLAYCGVDYGPVTMAPERLGTSFRLHSGTVRLPVGTMRTSTHGTSALHLAAGVVSRAGAPPSTTPLRDQRAVPADVAAAAGVGPGAPIDHASQWPIVFVQLPTRTILDTSGGSLGVHVLDGIRYILHRAACIPYLTRPVITQASPRAVESASQPVSSAAGANPVATSPATSAPVALEPRFDANRVVINVSYGAIAGPHDGTSIIEQAMADLVRTGPGGKKNPVLSCWICCAAGNAHQSKTQAQLMLQPGESKSFLWRIGADNPHESYLEVWLPDVYLDSDLRLPEEALRCIRLTIRPAGNYPPLQLRLGQACLCKVGSGSGGATDVLAGAIYARRVVQGLRGTMVLLAVRRTAAAVDATIPQPVTAHGEWQVEVWNNTGAALPHGNPGQAISVHAWVERNDLQYGNARRQQSTVIAEDSGTEQTESTPEARVFFNASKSWPTPYHLPNEMAPRYSFGTLAGVEMDRCTNIGSKVYEPGVTSFYEVDDASNGQLVAVGSYRIADGEMADYSSGGPQRGAHDSRRDAPQDRGTADDTDVYRTQTRPRSRPDVDAPGDVGPGIRGVRVVGIRAGSIARLSGTSAAAPSATRAIANFQYAEIIKAIQPPKVFGIRPEAAAPPQGRATLTPAKDDKFRRGRQRIS